MNKNLFGLLIILLLAISCKENTKTADPILNQTIQKEASFKRAFSDGDFNFQLEYNNRLDTSYFDVFYKGKKVSRQGFSGKVEDEFLTDLNNDKKNELYIVVKNSDRSSVFGYLFDNGKSIPIKREEFRDLSQVKSSKYKVENNQLVEQFKAPLKGGEMGYKEWRYNLVEREGEFVLLPQGWKPHELAQMTGQYAAQGDQKTGYYNVMLLNRKKGGIWNVSIKTKRKRDKKVLCDFSGDGYFVDKNLMVPMNKINSKLKGSLKIQFLDLMAIVYTIDQADSKEMTSFCSGNGSIAGNFLKTEI